MVPWSDELTHFGKIAQEQFYLKKNRMWKVKVFRKEKRERADFLDLEEM